MDEKGINPSADPEARAGQARRIHDSLREQYNSLKLRFASLQGAERDFRVRSLSEFDVAQDRAFEHLLEVTKQVLTAPNGDSRLRKMPESLTSLIATTERMFEDLCKVAEAIVDEYGSESRQCIELEEAVKDANRTLQGAKDALNIEIQGLSNISNNALADFAEKMKQLQNADKTLNDAKEKKDSILYKIFGDDDIDWQVTNAEGNVISHFEAVSKAEARAKQLSCLFDLEGVTVRDLDVCSLLYEQLLSTATSDFSRLRDIRNVSESTWSGIKRLSFHVESPDYQTTRDSCLRHILDLTHTQLGVIDADVDVQRAKMGIDDEIRSVLGDSYWEELERSKSALSDSEDL